MLRRNQHVTLATIGGPQPGIVVNPIPNKGGKLEVRKVYPARRQKNGKLLKASTGAVVLFHHTDVTPR